MPSSVVQASGSPDARSAPKPTTPCGPRTVRVSEASEKAATAPDKASQRRDTTAGVGLGRALRVGAGGCVAAGLGVSAAGVRASATGPDGVAGAGVGPHAPTADASAIADVARRAVRDAMCRFTVISHTTHPGGDRYGSRP